MFLYKVCSDDFMDVWKILVVQDLVNIFPILLAKLYIGLQLPGLLVFILEIFQLQTHTANARFVRTFGS